MEKKIIKQTITNTLDIDTGEVVNHKEMSTYKVPREPDYVKLYLGDIHKLYNLPNSNILYALLRKINYDGEVVLVSSQVKWISSECGISKNHFYKVLKKYVDAEILFKKSVGVYLFNPYVFGRGKWEDVENIRMTVEYNPTDGRKIVTDFTNQELPLISKAI